MGILYQYLELFELIGLLFLSLIMIRVIFLPIFK